MEAAQELAVKHPGLFRAFGLIDQRGVLQSLGSEKQRDVLRAAIYEAIFDGTNVAIRPSELADQTLVAGELCG
jgi:hypothetical protein